MQIIGGIARRLIFGGVFFKLYEWLTYLRFRRRLVDARNRGDLRLQLGSGTREIPGWVSIDMLMRRSILTMRLPGGLQRFPDESVQYIYLPRLLEHLVYPGDAEELARQSHRILRPGGTMRILVPGIEKIIRAYVADNSEFFRVQAEMHPE